MPQPQMTPTGFTLSATQRDELKRAAAGPTMQMNLETGITVHEVPLEPWRIVKKAAIAHGLPADKKYGANIETGEVFFLDYVEI